MGFQATWGWWRGVKGWLTSHKKPLSSTFSTLSSSQSSSRLPNLQLLAASLLFWQLFLTLTEPPTKHSFPRLWLFIPVKPACLSFPIAFY